MRRCRQAVPNADFPTIDAVFAPRDAAVDLNATHQRCRHAGKSRMAVQENVRRDVLPRRTHKKTASLTTGCASAELLPYLGRVASNEACSVWHRSLTK